MKSLTRKCLRRYKTCQIFHVILLLVVNWVYGYYSTTISLFITLHITITRIYKYLTLVCIGNGYNMKFKGCKGTINIV